MWIIRRTREKELDEVMCIYSRAVSFMAASGNPYQWTGGYPGRALIAKDIGRGVSYVIEVETRIAAVFSYTEGEDVTYREITDGEWLTDGTYGTVHRLASRESGGGMAKLCFDWCFAQAKNNGIGSLRVDTHRDNQIMRHLLEKNGFWRCGIIHLADGAARIAYERVALEDYRNSFLVKPQALC